MVSSVLESPAGHAKRGLKAGCAMTTLLALPAAVSVGVALGGVAQAQSVISGHHYSTVNLGIYTGSVAIAGGALIQPGAGNAVIGSPGTLWSLSNAGTVSAADGAGVSLDLAAILNTGLIAGTDGIDLGAAGYVGNFAGARITGSAYGVKLSGAGGSIANAGVITGGYDGISANAGGGVNNMVGGTITGGHIGVYTGHGFGNVANAGLISASSGDAVSIFAGGVFRNVETGDVVGGYTGVFAGGTGAEVSNAGVITGPDFGVYAGSRAQVTNSGTIAGGVDGVIAVGAGGSLNNSGMITGAKIGFRGVNNAMVENSGTITGGLVGAKLGDNSTLTNTAGGLIEGGSIGLLTGTGAVVNNAGTILDKTVAGMELGRGSTLVNTGTIGGVIGLLVNGAGSSIYNTGLIASTSPDGDAIELTGGVVDLTLGTGSVITGDIDGGQTASQISLVGDGILGSDIINFAAGSALDVAPGADWTASGNWTVAQVTNEGIFQPGIAGTPLNLTGDFTQTDSGTTRVLVSSTGTTAFHVTGAVQLAGQLDYVLAPGEYAPSTTSFLTATGGVTGSFSSVTTASPITPARVPVAELPQSQPQIQAQIQQIVLQQTGVAVPQQTSLTPPRSATVALVQSGNTVSLQFNQNFTVAPADDALFAEANQAMALDGERISDALLDHASGGAPSCAALPGGAGIAAAIAAGFCQAGGWVEASGSKFSQSGVFADQNAGFLAGIDRPVGPARLGLAAGYDVTDLTDKSGGKGNAATVRLGAYGSVPLGALVLSAGLMDGLVTGHSSRNTGAGFAASSSTGNVFAGAVQVAMPMRLGALLLAPAAGVDFAHVSTGGFGETAAQSAFAVRVGSSGGTSYRPYARLGVSESFATASQLVITPRASLGVTYLTGSAGSAVGMTSQDGTGFTQRAPGLDGLAGQMMAGVSAAAGNWSLTAKYEAQVAGNWTEQSVEGQLEVKF